MTKQPDKNIHNYSLFKDISANQVDYDHFIY